MTIRRHLIPGVLLASIAALGVFALRSRADDAAPRTRVVHARNALGVPLHPCAKCNEVSGRLADGTEVRVVGRADGGHWLEVASEGGAGGWIIEKYLVPAHGGGAHHRRAEGRRLPSTSPWASPGACARALASRRAPAGESADVHVGTWNLHWFPDGRSGHPGPEATDVPWMACVIAWMRLDVVAVQEVEQHLRGRRALLDLVAALGRHTGHRWKHRLDDCPDDGRQHVGFLWDAARVHLDDVRTLADLNPAGGACAHRLRPGLAARARLPGGSTLHLVVLHLDSGTTARDYHNRRASLRRLAAHVRGLGPGADVLVAGDLNTMGCAHCAPPVAADDEIEALDGLLETAGLTHLPLRPSCTEYYRGRPGWLDHVAVSPSLARRVPGGHARAEGPCGALSCAPPAGQAAHAAFQHLSDHCPVVLDLDARR